MSGIESKVVAITGASSGIGEATPRLLAERGASVVLGARRTERLDDIAREIGDRGGSGRREGAGPRPGGADGRRTRSKTYRGRFLGGSMRQGACLSCTLLVCWYPTGRPQDGTLMVVCAVPARVFGSHV